MKLTHHKIFIVFMFIAFGALNIFAQTEREEGIAFYRKADYKNAVKILKKTAKQNPADFQSLYYLGLAYLKSDDEKNARNAFEKAIKLNNADADVHAALGYTYLLQNNMIDAEKSASDALKINAKNPDAHYILGIANLRRGSFNYAYERAVKTIELSPNYASAYYLKTEALINSFAAQSRSVMKPSENKYEILREAAESMEKYVTLSPNSEDAEFNKEYLASLRFFARYYSQPENRKPINFDEPPKENPNGLKITLKPKPRYTNQARRANVSGNVRMMIEFGASGKIEHILITQGLGYGLDQQAIKAARQMKFEPEMRDGKPVSVVRTVIFNFLIY